MISFGQEMCDTQSPPCIKLFCCSVLMFTVAYGLRMVAIIKWILLDATKWISSLPLKNLMVGYIGPLKNRRQEVLGVSSTYGKSIASSRQVDSWIRQVYS